MREFSISQTSSIKHPSRLRLKPSLTTGKEHTIQTVSRSATKFSLFRVLQYPLHKTNRSSCGRSTQAALVTNMQLSTMVAIWSGKNATGCTISYPEGGVLEASATATLCMDLYPVEGVRSILQYERSDHWDYYCILQGKYINIHA